MYFIEDTLSLSIYIYIYTHTHSLNKPLEGPTYIPFQMPLEGLSLSLYIYICVYIYIHIHIPFTVPLEVSIYYT